MNVKRIFRITAICLLIIAMFACAVNELSAEIADIEVFPQTGHRLSVGNIIFSPDEKYLVSVGAYENIIKIWDIVTKRELRTLVGHSGNIKSIAISPDSNLLVSGSDDKTIKIWNIVNGRLIRTLTGHSNWDMSVAISPDGRIIASGAEDRTIKLWDISTGREIRTITGHSAHVNSVTFSPDGKFLASGADDGAIILWDISTGRAVRAFAVGHLNQVNSVAFSPDGKMIVSGDGYYSSSTKTVKLWDIASGRLIHNISTSSEVDFVMISYDGKHIVASVNWKIYLWDIITGDEVWSVSGSAIAYSPNGEQIAISSNEGIKLLDSNTKQETGIFSKNTPWVNHAVFSPDGKQIVSGHNDIVRLWDAASGQLKNTFPDTRNTECVAFSPNGKLMASALSSNKITKLWNIDTNQLIHTFRNSGYMNCVTFSPDGKFIATGSGSLSTAGLIEIWDVNTGEKIRSIGDGNSWFVTSLAFSPDGKTIFSGFEQLARSGDTVSLIMWDTVTGRKLRTIHESEYAPYKHISFSPNGKYLIVVVTSTSTMIWDTGTWQEKELFGNRLIEGMGSAAAYSPDGKYIVTGDIHGLIKLWDASNGRGVHNFPRYASSVESLAFSPDGKMILAAVNTAIYILDALTGKEIVQLNSFEGKDSQIAAASRGLTVESETAASEISGEWIAITPEGYYNASPRGDRYLNFRVNNTVTGIDSYRSIFYNPDVVQARLQGLPDPASKKNITIQEASRFIPPQVTIKSPATFTTTNTATTNLSVTITDQNQPLQTIKIFVNGRSIGRNELAAIKGQGLQAQRTSLTVMGNQKIVNFELPITLDPGRNLIEVVAFNGYSESPRLSPVEVTYNAPAGQQRQLPNLWILAIGVNKYDNAGLRMGGMTNLNFAVTDAKRLVESLKQQEGKRYAKVNSLIIGDGEALTPNVANIRRNLSFLNQAGDRDVVLLFLAGHGVSAQDSKFFFLPNDAVVSGSSGNWRVDERLAISGDEITAVLEGPGNRLLFIDACQSGGVDNNRMIRAMMETNAFVFAASQGNELSYESPQWGGGHGAFTYNILNALRGAPAALAEGNVSVRSMSGFVSLEVPKITDNRQNPKVYSLLFADFPLAAIR